MSCVWWKITDFISLPCVWLLFAISLIAAYQQPKRYGGVLDDACWRLAAGGRLGIDKIANINDAVNAILLPCLPPLL